MTKPAFVGLVDVVVRKGGRNGPERWQDAAVNYKDEHGAWQPIDATLVPVAVTEAIFGQLCLIR
jgi:hypothetical protein